MPNYSRIILILIFAIVLPFLIYAFIQVKSLEDDERIAKQIYQKQMETVLSSLNRHANDIVGRWMSQLAFEENRMTNNAATLVSANESIQMLVLRRLSDRTDSIYANEYVNIKPETQSSIDNWYLNQDSLIQKITEYIEAGYQKIQAAEGWVPTDGLLPSQSAITAMLYDKDSTLYNALFILETNYWIEQVLGAKMHELAQDNFRLSVMHFPTSSDSASVIYTTDAFEQNKEYVKNNLWVIPNTFLSIQSKGLSFTEIVRNRSETNLYILLTSIAVMLVGALYMIRNIRNTMKLAQLKSDFVSNVSHEIRTPLALIKMYAETLMLGRLPSDKKKQHYYNVIHHESGRLTYLVNNILDFSKIEANKKTYNKVRKDLNALVQALYDNYSYSFKEKNVQCTLTLHPTILDIMIDVQAFDEALSNLIENAIKYSNGKIVIDIRTRTEGDFAFCDVSDQGVGIPKKVQKQIFDKFFRVESALTQKTKGAGLGLSLVKHIVNAHDGEIEMKSKLNIGSTFTLKFPLIDSTS